MMNFFSKGIVVKVIAEDSNKKVVEEQQLPQRFVTLKEESKISILTLAYFGFTRNPSFHQWFANGPSPDTVSGKTFAAQQLASEFGDFTNI